MLGSGRESNVYGKQLLLKELKGWVMGAFFETWCFLQV